MIPDSLAISLIAPGLIFAFSVWAIAHWTLYKKRMERRGLISVVVAVVLLGWLLLVNILSRSDFFATNPLFAPNLFIGFLVLFELLRRLFSSSTIKRIIEKAPMEWIIGVQTYRIAGVVFLDLHAQGLLPAAFAIPSGYGDIIVGITAPIVAIVYYLRKSYARKLAILWNYIGIADLIIALTMGALAFPLPAQFLSNDVSTEILALYPMAIIPLFAVPLALVLHLLGLRALKVARNN